MKIFNVFLLFIILSSCTYDHYHVIPEEVEPYVNEFFQDARKNGLEINLEDFNIDISFSQLVNASGECNFNDGIILIDSSAWSSFHPLQKRLIIYHELGHCILNRDHYDKTFFNGENVSYMRGTNNFSENLVGQKWHDYYLKELFHKTNKLPDWYNLKESSSKFYIDNYEKFDTLLIVDQANEDTGEIIHTFKLDPTKNFQIVFNYTNLGQGNSPKIYTNHFKFALFGRGPSISLLYDKNASLFSFLEVYTSKKEFLQNNVVLKVKFNNGILFFYINDDLIHATDYDFTTPISLLNLNFKNNSEISVEAGNI